jgi:hypothetical protein
MALKATLDGLEGLSEIIQKEYRKGDDGKFHLDVDGIELHPSVGALKRSKDYEVDQRKSLSTQATKLQEQLAALTEERDGMLRGSVPKADVDKLEGSYKAKLSNVEKEYKDQLTAANSSLNTLLVGNVAQRLASEISKSPELIMPHILGRLKAEIVEGKPFTRVLDKDGGLTASSLEDFKKELIANPLFAPIIIGSKASGSSAPNPGQGGSAAQQGSKSLASMTPQELAAHMASKKV